MPSDHAVGSPEERLPTEIPGLDIVLAGGFVRGGMHVLIGGPGTGKTVMASQIAYRTAGAMILAAAVALWWFLFRTRGGYELRAAAQQVPVIVDGVIAAAALLVASRLVPGVEACVIAGHRSVEPGASAVLDLLGLAPVVDLGLRLGEGTGAVLALPLVEAALPQVDAGDVVPGIARSAPVPGVLGHGLFLGCSRRWHSQRGALRAQHCPGLFAGEEGVDLEDAREFSRVGYGGAGCLVKGIAFVHGIGFEGAQLFANGLAHAAIEDEMAHIATDPLGAGGGDFDHLGLNLGNIAGARGQEYDLMAEFYEGVARFANVGRCPFSAAYFKAAVTTYIEYLHRTVVTMH